MPAGSIAKPSTPKRPIAHTLLILALWLIFYGSFALTTPALLDDADSVHAEVAREMLLRHDYVTLYANGIRYLEKAPLLYWAMAASMRLSQLLGHASAAALATAARIPLALTVLALALLAESFTRRIFLAETFTRRASFCCHPERSEGSRETTPNLNLPTLSPHALSPAPSNHQPATQAALYAALILLSSFGLFLFTRILIPDALLTLTLTAALYAFHLTEQTDRQALQQPSLAPPKTPVILSEVKNPHISPLPLPVLPNLPNSSQSHRDEWSPHQLRLPAYTFASACALAVLTKGLIGLLFPIAIVLTHLLLTRGPRLTLQRLRQLHPISSLAVFLAIAAPWHILIALANPAQGHPANLTFTLHPAAGAHHWQVPLPTDGNVHGWAWFYFLNEHLLRYLNLRVPHDYDTVPLALFLGLILIWLMPWSIFLPQALTQSIRSSIKQISQLRAPHSSQPHRDQWGPTPDTHLLLLLWAAIPLLFFSFSTRQEYYVLPALPPLAILIALWLASDATPKARRTNLRANAVLLTLGTLFASATAWFLLHTHTPAPNTDLATLLQQNPTDYAMSLGHFLDLNAQALTLFRLPLVLAAAALFLGPLASYLLRRRAQTHTQTKPTLHHAANLCLAASAFLFLLAAHLGLRTFAPILSSQQLAAAIAPQIHPNDLLVIHQEYEYASTLAFYLQRPNYSLLPPNPSHPRANAHPEPHQVLHILTDPTHNDTPNYGRSANLWYGSYFPDAPRIFETPQSLAQKWHTPQRIFLWQDLANDPSPPPATLTPIYVIARSGGKAILSNQPNHP